MLRSDFRNSINYALCFMKKNAVSKDKYILLFILILGLVLRLIPAFYTPIVGDTSHWQRTGASIFAGKNPYQLKQKILFPYPPLWMIFEGSAYWLSRTLNLPFGFIIKLPLICSDLGIAVLLFYLVSGTVKQKLLGVLVFILNPISILITSFHGQFDTLPIFFICIALLFFRGKKTLLSAFSLGLGIALKTFPVLLLPFFLFSIPGGWKKKLNSLIISLAPIILLLMPFLILDYSSVQESFFNYSGWTDHGWMSIIRAGYWLSHNFIYQPTRFLDQLLLVNKLVFLGFWTVCIWKFRHTETNLCLQIASVFLAFFLIYGGISSQYLVWPLVFLILSDSILSFYYSIFAGFALLGYYSFFLPRLFFWMIPFWTITAEKEALIKKPILENAGLITTDPLGLAIKSVLIFHLFTQIIWWFFLSVILFKYLFPRLLHSNN